MFDQSYGLRFDIYERVHLSEEVVGIQELEEIELVPSVQVIPLGDQATLRGSLLLSGVYRGDDPQRSSLTLEHFIPVEITLPMNRVQSISDIAVEIENFDVDLLSTRTLNINGVLLLRGIEMVQHEPTPWMAEQFTVVHQNEEEEQEASSVGYPWREAEQQADGEERPAEAAEQQVDEEECTSEAAEQQVDEEERLAEAAEQAVEDVLESVSLYEREQQIERELTGETAVQPEEAAAEGSAEETVEEPERFTTPNVSDFTPSSEPPAVEQSEARDTPFAARNSPSNSNFFAYISSLQADKESETEQDYEQESEAELEQPEEQRVEPIATGAQPEAADGSEWQTPFYDYGLPSSPAFTSAIPEAADLQERIAAERKDKELKVAFNSMKPQAAQAAPAPYQGFSTIFNVGHVGRTEVQPQAEQQELQTSKQPAASGDEVEWKSIFLAHEDHNRAFRKVKLCIVQREETLDTIAERYQMNPRELLLYNRLTDQTISEGQVIYIPS